MGKWDPVTYHVYSSLPRNDTKYYLDKYGHDIKLNGNLSILDVGCGDGYVSTKILSEFLGNDYKELVGVDYNERMIEYANKTYGDNKKVFKVFDMTTNELPKEFENRFEHVFSFYCFNWFGNGYSTGLLNINKMMKKGARFNTIFAVEFVLYRLNEKLSKYPKYAPHMQDVGEKTPDYYNFDKKDEWFKTFLNKNGFRVNFCEILEMTHTYPSVECYLKTMKTIMTFEIPQELQNDFYNDLLMESRKLNCIVFETNVVRLSYQSIAISAVKE